MHIDRYYTSDPTPTGHTPFGGQQLPNWVKTHSFTLLLSQESNKFFGEREVLFYSFRPLESVSSLYLAQ